MEIIIGREPGLRRLHCTVDGREFDVGQAGSVPLSVSRQHCKIVVSGNSLSIENLKAANVTYVDGNQIMSKGISATSKVQLGAERYGVPLQQILQLATGSPSGQPQPTFSLKPLESVWAEYDRRRMEIQNQAAKWANRQRLQGILSMLGMCIGFVPGIDQAVRIAVIVAALALAVYFFVKGGTNATVQQQLHDLDEEYSKKYKCPNPACGKPFGSVPYRNIEFNKQCFACGCKYTH